LVLRCRWRGLCGVQVPDDDGDGGAMRFSVGK